MSLYGTIMFSIAFILSIYVFVSALSRIIAKEVRKEVKDYLRKK